MQPDQDRKTHPASKRKLARARRQGELAYSRELASVAAAAAGLIALALALPGCLAGCLELARACFAGAEPGVWRQALELLGRSVARVGGAAACAALAVGLSQVGLRFCYRWRFSRLDPLAGFRRLFSAGRLPELGLLLLRVSLAAVAGGLGLWAAAPAVVALAGTELAAAGRVAEHCLRPMLWACLAAGLAGGLLDWWWQRSRHLRRQRMTREEVIRERKEQEGDPALKAERRRRHRQAAAGLGSLAQASVLVVNPTHAAAALRYRPEQPEQDDAPLVLACGWGQIAARLRREALQRGVPIVEQVPLARALAVLEPGTRIPESLYEACAQVIRALEELG